MSEHYHQKAFFAWVGRQKRPELDAIFAVPNGGHRHPAVAAKLKAEGVRPGVPDVLLPSPRGGFVGLAIEFKFDAGNCTKEQRERITRMQIDGWMCVVAWDWEAAARTVLGYLDMPKWEILKCMTR
jgi:hypothetical protein